MSDRNSKRLPIYTVVVAFSTVSFSLMGCSEHLDADASDIDSDEPDESGVGEQSSPFIAGGSRDAKNDDPILKSLAAAGNWELAPSQAKLTVEAPPPQFDEMSDTELEALKKQAEADPAWYAEDGERYDALYVTDGGVVYGRRGPAPEAKVLGEKDDYGAFHGLPSPPPSDKEYGFGALGEDPSPSSGIPGVGPDDLGIEESDPLGVEIGVDSSDDQRGRIAPFATLQSYPWRTVGAMTPDGDTTRGGCTGTKIGPRAVLTASHCVLGSTGSVTLNGVFNAGQTNLAVTGGSIPWNGVFFRDWRVDRKYDYAVFFLSDSAETVGLGWMGTWWSTSAAAYNGVANTVIGYPCGANGPGGCGTIAVQTCKAAQRVDKRCDGWMYTDASFLNTASFMAGEQLLFYNDVSKGQSGSAVWRTSSGGLSLIMGVVAYADGPGTNAKGPRFRQSMWDDVCSWIGQKPSTFGTHPCQ